MSTTFPGQCSAAYALPAKDGFLPDYACRNGFPLTGSCLGTAGTPVCCREELCGHLYNHCGGWPLAKASGIEARQGGDACGSVHESLVAKPDAQIPEEGPQP